MIEAGAKRLRCLDVDHVEPQPVEGTASDLFELVLARSKGEDVRESSVAIHENFGAWPLFDLDEPDPDLPILLHAPPYPCDAGSRGLNVEGARDVHKGRPSVGWS